jgi:hypothetical protein
MNCTIAFLFFDVVESGRAFSRSVASTHSRYWKKASWTAFVFVFGFASPSNAQLVPLTSEPVDPPWNAQQIFDPTPLPELTDPDTREDIAPEDMPVMKRQQPGYEPVGIRDGAWMFNPSLTAGGFFDSNVFSSNTMNRSDFATTLSPTLRAHTLWERNGIDLTLNSKSTFYSQFSSLNQTDASLKGSGHFDIAHDLMLLTNFKIAHLNEGVGTLSSPSNAISPTPYDLFSGDVTLRKEFNRLTTSLGVRADSYNFGSTRAQDGSTINQDARDGQIYSVHGRVDYAFSPTFGWFSAAEGNQRDLRGTSSQSLDSQGYRALSGFTLGLTHLIKGEFGAGYVSQRFDDPSIGTISGPSYRALLTWSPTRLVDVHFKAEQLVSESSDTSSSGVLANAFQLGADYELRRNVIATLTAGYEKDKFFGQERKDNVLSADARIKYLMNRYFAVSPFYKYTKRSSDIPTFSYDKHQVGINVTAQF